MLHSALPHGSAPLLGSPADVGTTNLPPMPMPVPLPDSVSDPDSNSESESASMPFGQSGLLSSSGVNGGSCGDEDFRCQLTAVCQVTQ